MLLKIARASLYNRRVAAFLTLLTIAISVALLLAVERIRVETRNSFSSTISGTDLIVGARTGPVQLLLYSVFRIGDATNNIRYSTFEEIAAHPQVAFAIPISLGDSHRGFRVLGTNRSYFEHFRYGDKRSLAFSAGQPFADLYDAVVGAEVARQLDYRLGQEVVIAHGTGRADIMRHDDKPFRIVGILERTGTPVDRSVHVSLEAIEAIHIDWQSGARLPGRAVSADAAREMDLKPKAITAVFVGLKTRMAAFSIQRQINEYRGEPLLAVMPGVTLMQLWGLIGVAENALRLVAIFVVIAGILGMITALVTTLNERRREMAILRAVGARPWQIGALLVLEAAVLSWLGALVGAVLLIVAMAAIAPWLASEYGLFIQPLTMRPIEWALLGIVVLSGILAGLIPSLMAYSRSLSDGLSIRV
jgi:putative ABC transport system permease protein